jgi:hypothetical protein
MGNKEVDFFQKFAYLEKFNFCGNFRDLQSLSNLMNLKFLEIKFESFDESIKNLKHLRRVIRDTIDSLKEMSNLVILELKFDIDFLLAADTFRNLNNWNI